MLKRGRTPASFARQDHTNVTGVRSTRSRTRLAVASLLALSVTVGCPGVEEEPPGQLDTESARSLSAGPVVGFTTDEGAHAWRGIPFAAPPVGDLRWRAPRPGEPWSETLQALSYGASCVQFAGPAGSRDGAASGEVTGSEDCLFLNVYAPKFLAEDVPKGDTRLPVMFWIHGGGNTVGDATVYDASRLAMQEQVIVVTVHYRMGVFGWFSHPALRGTGTDPLDASGNYGTLDLVRGLAWVQENISAFGGDPERVTIFGESAGGRNVISLLLSPPASGLFQRAISESGQSDTTPLEEAEGYDDDPDPGQGLSSGDALIRYLTIDGRAKDREDAKRLIAEMDREKIAEYLRSKTPSELLAAYHGAGFGGMYRIPQLVRDGAVLPSEDPIEAFESGHYNQVPSILGTNRDEARLFMLFSSPHIAKLGPLPLWVKDVDLYQAKADYPSRMWKVRGVDAPAAAMREVQGDSVFAYRFDWDEEPRRLFLRGSDAIGAAHALEIPFVFGWLTLGPGTPYIFSDDKAESNRQLSDAIMSYWSQFAYSGNPGRGRSGNLPLWQSWSSAEQRGDKFIVLDSQAGGGIRMSSDAPLSRELVIAGVATDPRLKDSKRDRCEVYHSLVVQGRTMSEQEYAAVEEGVCGNEYPIDAHPW